MKKYQNKYRITSVRALFWNYTWEAAYFVTICTQNRKCWFGEIKSETNAKPSVLLSPIGIIVESEWLKTFEMRPDMNLWMGAYVVMPNHFHAIIGIGANAHNAKQGRDAMNDGRDAMHCVSTGQSIQIPKSITVPQNHFGPQSKNLASIIRGFKIGVTKNARQIDPNFMWQSRYHDHIIRTAKSFKNIRNYILKNPNTWLQDKFYKS